MTSKVKFVMLEADLAAGELGHVAEAITRALQNGGTPAQEQLPPPETDVEARPALPAPDVPDDAYEVIDRRRPVKKRATKKAARKTTPPRKTKPEREPAATSGDQRGKMTPAKKAAGQKRIEAGEAFAAVAADLNVSEATLRYHAKRGGWRVASGRRKGTSNAQEGVDTPARICHSCQQQVRRDPCPFCGAPWKRR